MRRPLFHNVIVLHYIRAQISAIAFVC